MQASDGSNDHEIKKHDDNINYIKQYRWSKIKSRCDNNDSDKCNSINSDKKVY